MITIIALTFPDDSPSLDLVLRALRKILPADEREIGADVLPLPPIRRAFRPPPFIRNSRRFRLDDDPDEWSN
jgi:hypothetical protein